MTLASQGIEVAPRLAEGPIGRAGTAGQDKVLASENEGRCEGHVDLKGHVAVSFVCNAAQGGYPVVVGCQLEWTFK
jgi:hypothetical protein